MQKNKGQGLCICSVLCYGLLICAALLAGLALLNNYNGFMQSYFAALTMEPKATLQSPAPQKLEALKPRKVEFILNDKAAKEVYLNADFNLWGDHKIMLEKNKNGAFTKTVVLPQGEYKYFFEVDGRPIKDPSSKQNILYEGKEVSLKTVL
ncbi:MAG: hypothetical protein LBM71_05075 [Elusimicrobiota bacterium]|jgi:1,4-alpha-glucan branching enzyme|nr:hypothetical protein [Elusimicrobiota bacterium]